VARLVLEHCRSTVQLLPPVHPQLQALKAAT
jgi:hypothetical protein